MKREFLVVFSALVLGGCAGLPRATPPQPDEIVRLSKTGVPAAQIVQRIRDSDAVYRLSASELAKLREQGVGDAVIDAMQQTWVEDARREGYRDGLMHGPAFGPWPCWRFGCW